MNINKIVELIMSLLTSRTTESKNSSKKVPSPSLEDKKDPELKLVDGYYVWQKGYIYPLTAHFSTKEMECHCSYPECKEQRISKDLVEKAELIRIEVGQPLVVTSAFRCSAYQAHLRATRVNTVVAKKSTHELGDALDIVPKDRKDVRGYFFKICAKYFDSIGLSDKFLHVDERKGVRRWEY